MEPCYVALEVPRTHGAGRRAGGFDYAFPVGDLTGGGVIAEGGIVLCKKGASACSGSW